MSAELEAPATTGAVGYIRVSTADQAERGLSLDVQRGRIAEWAAAHDCDVVIHEDAGRSGADDVLARPGLAAAINALEAAHPRTLVVYRLDRLSRQLGIQEYLLHTIRKTGGQVVSCQPSEADALDDAGDPMRAAFRQFVGIIAQLERDLIAARTRAGREAKRAKGLHWTGPPPWGWRRDGNGGLCPDEAVWDVVLEAVGLRDGDDPWSYTDIADEFNGSGILAPSGGLWSAKQVWRLIRTFRDGPAGCQPVDECA